MFNTTPKFTDATEPTNIIWENRHIKGINYCARLFSAMCILVFMMTIAFIVIFLFKQAQIKNQEKWPDVNCEEITASFDVTHELSHSTLDLSDWAGIEY